MASCPGMIVHITAGWLTLFSHLMNCKWEEAKASPNLDAHDAHSLCQQQHLRRGILSPLLSRGVLVVLSNMPLFKIGAPLSGGRNVMEPRMLRVCQMTLHNSSPDGKGKQDGLKRIQKYHI